MLKIYYLACLSFLLIASECVRCEPDYVFNLEAGGWLKLHSTPDTWNKAFLRCLSEGAVLASPLNKDLAKALHSQAAQLGVNRHIFLGTHDLYSNGHFASVEGVPLADMDIKLGSLGNEVYYGHCLTLSVDGSAYHSSCEEALPFVCYRKLDNRTMNECGTLDNEYHLNQQTGSCYKIHRDGQTWSSAYGICDTEGGHLVILNDEEEARIINAMFPDEANQDARFHVGIVAWGEKRIWTTIHGQRVEDVYNKWTPGQPDNLGGIQDKGAFLKSGRLDDVGSAGPEWLPFVCEKSPVSKRFETLPPCIAVLKSLCRV